MKRIPFTVLFCLLLVSVVGVIGTRMFLAPVGAQVNEDAYLLYSARLPREGSEKDWIIAIHRFNVTTGEDIVIADLPDHHSHAGSSPDGRYIWTVVEQRLTLFDEAVSERVLAEDVIAGPCVPQMEWSPDGQYLVYYSLEDKTTVNGTIIRLADDRRYTFENVTQPSYNLLWSPDMRYVLLPSRSGPSRMVDLSDGSVVQNFPGQEAAQSESFLFSPDTRYLTYYDTTPENGGAYLYDIAAGRLTRISESVVNPNYVENEFSPDSRHLGIVVMDDEAPLIIVYDIVAAEATEMALDYDNLRWSPDSRYLLLMPYMDEGPSYTFDTQTNVVTRVPPDMEEPDFRLSRWTQDGTGLYGVIGQPDKGQSVVRYTFATGELTTLLTTGHIIGIFENGRWLTILYDDKPSAEASPYLPPATHIHITDGTTVTDIAMDLPVRGYAVGARSLSLSPDKRWMSLLAAEEVYLFDARAGSLEKLPVPAAWAQLWSYDSRYLATFESGTSNVVSVWDTTTGKVVQSVAPVTTLIGWQHSDEQEPIEYCGEG